MRKRNRFFLLCCLSFLAVWSGMAQSISLPRNNKAVTADTIESELYTSVSLRTTTYYDLGCKHQGLQGYFAPDRWYKTVNFGDGGVDVTEAPNAKVVEGATGARLIVQTKRSNVYTWRITIPADGVLFFRLEKIGSFLSQRISSTDTDLQFFHNNQLLSYEPLADGGYYSPNLKAGDVFSISFHGEDQRYEWNDFTFYSNCIGVEIIESGGKDDVSGRWKPDRVRPIPRARIDQVFFSDQHPEQWPIIDQDGDLFTIEDQIFIQPGINEADIPFEFDFQDRVEAHEGQFWQMRRFTFREPCSGNTMSVERPWLPLPLVSLDTKEDIRK